jgi:hypothetical protein
LASALDGTCTVSVTPDSRFVWVLCAPTGSSTPAYLLQIATEGPHTNQVIKKIDLSALGPVSVPQFVGVFVTPPINRLEIGVLAGVEVNSPVQKGKSTPGRVFIETGSISTNLRLAPCHKSIGPGHPGTGHNSSRCYTCRLRCLRFNTAQSWRGSNRGMRRIGEACGADYRAVITSLILKTDVPKRKSRGSRNCALDGARPTFRQAVHDRVGGSTFAPLSSVSERRANPHGSPPKKYPDPPQKRELFGGTRLAHDPVELSRLRADARGPNGLLG